MGSGNWIVDNLNSALEMWNGRLAEIWQLITTSPENFKGGGIQRMKRRNDPQPYLRGAVCAGNIVPAFLCGVSVDFLDAAAVQTEPHENMGPIRLFSQFDRHC